MKEYLLPENVRAALLAYLTERPYREVADGVEALLTLRAIEPRPPQDNAHVAPGCEPFPPAKEG